MKLKTITLAVILSGVFTVASNADTIMFEGSAPTSFPFVVPVGPTTPYLEDGFGFTPSASGESAVISAVDPNKSFPGDNTDWFAFSAGNVITMALTLGGTFNLGSLDVGPDSVSALSPGFTDVTVTGYVGATAMFSAAFTDLTAETLETLNWAGVTSVTFSANNSAGLDNISTDLGPTVPEPGTFLLLGAGLIAVGSRYRRKQ